jgi:hypothetical protein
MDVTENNNKREYIRDSIIYYGIITFLIVAVVGYITFNALKKFGNDDFCNVQGDGIHYYKKDFILCKDGDSTVLDDYRNYTKAICNSTNFCIDCLITCSGNILIDIIPLDDGIQFGANWQDNRPNQLRWGWCDG